MSAVAMPLNSPSSSSNGPLLQNDDSRQALVDSQAHASKQIAAALLDRPTAKQRLLARLMRSRDNRFQEFCTHLTRAECTAARTHAYHASSSRGANAEGRQMYEVSLQPCTKIHFAPVYRPHTDPSFGHCSYLNTCHRTGTCKYMHFTLDDSPAVPTFVWEAPYAEDSEEARDALLLHPIRALEEHGLESWTRSGSPEQLPPQWIDCDLKNFDYSILGKFDVIVADPPWDIHMSLPYGTMSDDDMRAMPFPQLQDEGFLFLWVTGRAMELGRELLGHWGYTRIDELVWVKVGQTQRLIRTGRTGHWLNHTKEHCLIGAKVTSAHASQSRSVGSSAAAAALSSIPSSTPSASGGPPLYTASHAPGVAPPLPRWAHQGLGADVIVSEVRDTSRKPDELYGLIERLCPGGRKVELFGRRHNARRGWITLGNQLKGDCVHDPELREKLAESRRAQASAQR